MKMNMLDKIFKHNQAPDNLSAITLSLKQIIGAPITSFIIILAMTLALFFAITFYNWWQNIEALNDKWNESAEISLYLKKKITLKDAEALTAKLQSKPLVAKVELIRPDAGMKTFVANTMLNTLLSSFKENPLPSVIVVCPKIKLMTKEAMLQFIQELKNYVEVETVHADQDWMERSYHWLSTLDSLSWVFVLLFGINAVLVLSGISYVMAKIFTLKNNTHKIILQYQFVWYGLISGLLALLWSRVVTTILQDHDILLQEVSIGFGVLLVLIGMFLCFISARIGAK